MKNELSSLLDDELNAEHQAAVVAALCADTELCATWCQYQLIGDALRSRQHLTLDLTPRVMQQLAHEPAYLLPAHRQQKSFRHQRLAWLQGGMRVAAAVAGVAVVGWLALSAGGPSEQQLRQMRVVAAAPAPVAANTQAQPAGELPQRQNQSQTSRLQSYLVAHQAYSPGNRFDGGASYVRTVATRQ